MIFKKASYDPFNERLDLPDDADGGGVQYVEDSGRQTVSSVFGQPALAQKVVLNAFGGNGHRQLVHQPAALGSRSVMTQLRTEHQHWSENSLTINC